MSKSDFTPTQIELKTLFCYDPNIGVFTRLIRACPSAAAGSIAGYIENGYVRIFIKHRKFPAHRLAWLWAYGEYPLVMLDHINGNRSDNRIVNLRQATASENSQNVNKAHRDKKSGPLLGAYRNGSKWRAQICVNGKVKTLGAFSDEQSAHLAYMKEKSKIHPAYSPSNFMALCFSRA